MDVWGVWLMSCAGLLLLLCSDLVATLEGLVERCGHRIDYIIIETSGMAHPGNT